MEFNFFLAGSEATELCHVNCGFYRISGDWNLNT